MDTIWTYEANDDMEVDMTYLLNVKEGKVNGGINLRKSSYLSIFMGVLLLAIEYIFLFDNFLGYSITTLGVVLIMFGVLINKKIRDFLVNVVINFL